MANFATDAKEISERQDSSRGSRVQERARIAFAIEREAFPISAGRPGQPPSGLRPLQPAQTANIHVYARPKQPSPGALRFAYTKVSSQTLISGDVAEDAELTFPDVQITLECQILKFSMALFKFAYCWKER